MNAILPPGMIEATRLTRAGRLGEATALLQGLLGQAMPAGTRGRIIDLEADPQEPVPNRMPALRGPATPPPAAAPRQGQFQARRFRGAEGGLDYKLYTPARQTGAPAPLVIMLHGCTQSPDDFAAGTGMNALAEQHGCLIAYPAQSRAANPQGCWNWFNPADQQRDQGEPALIAGLTRQLMREHPVDPRRVYVAGLSAGGAAAAIMARAYPELYAAVGVHSGLPCGAAHDMPSAFAAMRRGAGAADGRGRRVPTIVFHSQDDRTVHPGNADRVIAQAMPAGLRVETEQGQVPGGRDFTRTTHRDAAGLPVLEQWRVQGGGHAWSGGSQAGSYTDPAGPDASREMLRFFLSHALPSGG